jgi:molybdopterin/thiamine biosynthesis adenylyltransferase
VLASLRVLVVGAGSVADPIAIDLARLRPAKLRLADPKRHRPVGLLTQAFPWDVGREKVEVTGRRVKALSPDTGVFVLPGLAQDIPVSDWADTDVVVMATDNLAAEAWVGSRCAALGIPLLHAALDGAHLVSEIRFFGNAGPDSPCPVCAFNRDELAAWRSEARFSCEGDAVPASAPIGSQPSRSIAFLAKHTASLAGLQLIRHFLRLAAPVADTLLTYYAMTHRAFVVPLARNPACVAAHERWVRSSLPRPIGDHSAADLVVAVLGSGPGASVELDDFEFLEKTACACPAPVELRRFVPAVSGALPSCPVCLHPRRRIPFFTRRAVPLSLLAETDLAARPLASLCAFPIRWALVRSGSSITLLLNPNSSKAP